MDANTRESSVKRKVIIDSTDHGYWEIEDVTEQYVDILREKGQKFADDFFRPGTFSETDVEESNGEHFLYGFMESLSQSDSCPQFLYHAKELRYTVEEVK